VKYVVEFSNGKIFADSHVLPGYPNATVPKMELKACVLGLERARKLDVYNRVNKIVSWSDSRYVVDNYRSALYAWYESHWFNKDGRPIANATEWKEFRKIYFTIRKENKYIEIRWLRGHSGDVHHAEAHRLAKLSAEVPFQKALSYIGIRKRQSLYRTSVGSVCLRGQKMAIRIKTAEYLREQKLHKYAYEVIEKNSSDYEKSDIAFSNILLREGGRYVVDFNANGKNPRILKMIREIDDTSRTGRCS